MVRGRRTRTKKHDLLEEICHQIRIPIRNGWKSKGGTICADSFEAILCRIAQTTGIPPNYLEEHEKLVWRLIHKSEEAMVLALEVINKPGILYRMECFLFLFINAWELLLKAKIITENKDIESIKDKDDTTGKRSIPVRRSIVMVFKSDKDPIRLNLFRLDDLRDEATHHVIPFVPPNAMQLFQAGIFNYERMIKNWFNRSLCERIPHGMMFLVSDLDPSQITLDSPLLNKTISSETLKSLKIWQEGVRNEIESLEDDEVSLYAIPIHLKLTAVNNPSKADVLSYWKAPTGTEPAVVWRDRERPKYRPGHVVEKMKEKGYSKFKMHQHTLLWKSMEAKESGKGYGVEVDGTWFWYDNWIELVSSHCKENADKYR